MLRVRDCKLYIMLNILVCQHFRWMVLILSNAYFVLCFFDISSEFVVIADFHRTGLMYLLILLLLTYSIQSDCN